MHGRGHRDLSQSAKGGRLIGLERALSTFEAAGRDVSVQTVQVLENVFERMCHGLFEGAVGFALSIFGTLLGRRSALENLGDRAAMIQHLSKQNASPGLDAYKAVLSKQAVGQTSRGRPRLALHSPLLLLRDVLLCRGVPSGSDLCALPNRWLDGR